MPHLPEAPYLLDGPSIDRPNHVWAAPVTYIPMVRGFCYLVGIIDVFSRRLLAWRVSNSLDTRFCLDALEKTLVRFGRPEIFNSEQGAQFTSKALTGVLEDSNIRVSMDGKGGWRDNVFMEHFWWSLKYEHVYLHAYDDLRIAKQVIGAYVKYYNRERRHSSVEKRTRAQAYEQYLPLAASSSPAHADWVAGISPPKAW